MPDNNPCKKAKKSGFSPKTVSKWEVILHLKEFFHVRIKEI
jgi:hypothetical protein